MNSPNQARTIKHMPLSGKGGFANLTSGAIITELERVSKQGTVLILKSSYGKDVEIRQVDGREK